MYGPGGFSGVPLPQPAPHARGTRWPPGRDALGPIPGYRPLRYRETLPPQFTPLAPPPPREDPPPVYIDNRMVDVGRDPSSADIAEQTAAGIRATLRALVASVARAPDAEVANVFTNLIDGWMGDLEILTNTFAETE